MYSSINNSSFNDNSLENKHCAFMGMVICSFKTAILPSYKLNIMRKYRFLILFVIMMIWIYGFNAYMNYFNSYQQMIAVLLIFAPIAEEVMFRETFYQFGKRFKALALASVVSSVLFGFVHINHYFEFGEQYAFMVQGMMGLILFQVRKQANLFWCMVMHSAWNATLFFLFPYFQN